jgi:putative endonuclease
MLSPALRLRVNSVKLLVRCLAQRQSIMGNTYYVYIMTNHSRALYTGVTNDLRRHMYEPRQKLVPGFTSKYNINCLVYFETTSDGRVALAREKQIKGWLRAKKSAIIESAN